MDDDREVVREPFDDNEVERSPEHHNDDRSNARHSPCGDNSIQNNLCAIDKSISDYKADQTDRLYLNEDGSSEENSIEDTKFAESFGIELKSSSTYERIFEPSQDSKLDIKPSQVIKTSVTSDSIYHKGTFYQKGDIVALCDQDDGQLYFAQLTGFLQDQYCEKSASLYWLVPTRATSREFFDPSAYKIGLEDTQLRKLDCMIFVRHCPHDYYTRKFFHCESGQSDQVQSIEKTSNNKQGYIWTTMRPCRVPTVESKTK